MTDLAMPYTHADLAHALREAGLQTGDVVFVHPALDALGPCTTGNGRDVAAMAYAALREVLGATGTLLVPTYTFSFCRNEPFDVQETPTTGGLWGPSADFLEYVRRRPTAMRSHDPIHSVAGEGPRAAELLADVPATCFGAGSVFDRLRGVGGKICMIGLGLDEASFWHFSEESVGVPFRYQKLFTGRIHDRGTVRKLGWLYHVRMLADNGFPNGHRLEAQARAAGICRTAHVGIGDIVVTDAVPFHDLTVAALARDPWFTANGPAADPVAVEDARIGAYRPRVRLSPTADISEMVDALWCLPRHIVSDGYDAALEALATQVPMTIHEFPSGLDCWGWIVPEKWTCHEAYLERLDGERLFSSTDNPLHVVSYSLPFEGEVPREVLLQHLHVHPKLPDAVPFIFKYYERDWGLCCSQRLRDTLTDPAYRVVIRSRFSFGALKVGEVVAPGQSEQCIVLCAHLCHPAMVNDDLSGVVVGMEVMRALLARRDLRYTYRFLIVPETIGSLAYLSRFEQLIPLMRGGLFLEMLGMDQPHALQFSFAGDTPVDRAFTAGLWAADPVAWTAPFRTLMGNDERQFNAPGVRVPMLSLSRVLRPTHPEYPYLQYHSSEDTPAVISLARLAESRDAVLSMIAAFDRMEVPMNRFRGEPFCSRYGIHIDPFQNPQGNRALFDVMYLIDGTRTLGEIAERCGIAPQAAWATIQELVRHGLVSW